MVSERRLWKFFHFFGLFSCSVQSANRTRKKPEEVSLAFDLPKFKMFTLGDIRMKFSYYNLWRIFIRKVWWIFQVVAHNSLWSCCSSSLLCKVIYLYHAYSLVSIHYDFALTTTVCFSGNFLSIDSRLILLLVMSCL